MANFANKILTSLHGRALGIQHLSSGESGSGNGTQRFLAGTVIGIRSDVTTGDSTATNAKAHGLSGASTGSSAVHTIDPPIPGIQKILVCSGGSTVYYKTANGESIESTAGSSFTTVKFTLAVPQTLVLFGVTTARWFTQATTAVFTFSTST